jgi:Zn-dependent peptidase ImmA (M78 family)/transcriptional regulator with XRE-family HTH domain
MPSVNPEILVWARETAGLSLEEAARAIQLNAAYGKTGGERLAELEAGQGEPSRSLLLRMSKKYRRSLVIFYLDKPPRREDRGQDFRTLPHTEYDPNLDALIRDLKTRQNLVKSLLEDEEVEPLSFIGSAQMGQGVEVVSQSIVETIRFGLGEFRARRTISQAFSYLRERVESVGVFVLLLKNLGSRHNDIPVEVFRGFAIADPIAPFVVVNNGDARVAWSFTMLHQVAHLWLGTTGISGTSEDIEIERFCNQVAGNILLPAAEMRVLQDVRAASIEEAIAAISRFADERNISRAMVAYNLYLTQNLERPQWLELQQRFDRERESAEGKKKEGREGGPDYYTIRRRDLGPSLIRLVDRSMRDGSLTPTRAARILGLKPGNVQ